MSDSKLSNSIFGEGEDDAASSTSYAQERQPREKAPQRPGPSERVKRNRRGCVAMLLAMVLIVTGVGVALSQVGSGVLSLFGRESGGGDYDGEGKGSVEVQVKQGDSGWAIGERLRKAGVVKSADTFSAVAGTNPDFSKIQPGTYKLREKMSSASAVDMLLDPKARVSTAVTIPEGLWSGEIFERLSKGTGTPVAQYKAVKPSQLGLPPSANGKIEGFLFPSTYDFAPGTSAQDQLKEMVALSKKTINQLGVPADKLRETVTVASIVQAESRLGEDGPKVARVIENRLDEKMPLQMDSTVHYVFQARGTVTTTDKERESDSPYNTYKHPGLPPGPINNPGKEALEAAAKPAEGDWLYFVTVDQKTGETKFTESYEEHQKNVKEFQSWCRANPGQC